MGLTCGKMEVEAVIQKTQGAVNIRVESSVVLEDKDDMDDEFKVNVTEEPGMV